MAIKDKYQEIIDKFEDLEKQLQDPIIINNSEKLQKISTEHGEIAESADKIKALIIINTELEETQEMLDSTDADKDMSALYTEEIKELTTKKSAIEAEIQKDLQSTDPNDKRNTLLEIRAGTGGEEAALFAADLFRMYSRFAEKNKWQISLLSANYTGNGGFKEAIIQIIGKGSYGKLKLESGVHRVQRVPSTESSGRLHTSAASVVALPEVNDAPNIHIQENDIKIDVYRATGPGGQSVNTTDSAVRITHLPSGIVVTCQDGKSQHKNKDKALSILKSRLYQIKQEEIASKASDKRKSAIQTGDRSAKIRTYNFPQNRVTDHRIKKSWHNLTEILNGDLDEIISETKVLLSDV